MKAYVLDRYGKAANLRLTEMPEPELREDEVLVDVHAASINVLDSKIRDGEFKQLLPYRLPVVLGNDVAGVVVRVGSRVQRLKPGDEVYARAIRGETVVGVARGQRVAFDRLPRRGRERRIEAHDNDGTAAGTGRLHVAGVESAAAEEEDLLAVGRPLRARPFPKAGGIRAGIVAGNPAPLAPILAMCAGDGLARLGRVRPQRRLLCQQPDPRRSQRP